MIGGAPSGGERAPASQKDQAVAYLQGEIKKAQAKVDDLQNRIDRYTKPTSRRPLPQPPTHSDGGGDWADYRLAVGERREEDNQSDYYSSPEVERELDHLKDAVHLLERDLHDIQGGDEYLIENYYAESQKVAK